MNKLSYLATLLASAAVGSNAQNQMCSCSPTIFNFVLDFSNYDCAVDTIKDNPGVADAYCYQEEVAAVPGEPASDSPVRRLHLHGEHDEEEPRNLQTVDKIVEVVSAQFLELDTNGDLTVINQDDTYATTSLKDGDTMQFYSVSSMLNTSVPLEDQMGKPNLVPGGASLIMYGKTESGKVVRNRFFWLYQMDECGRENSPVQVDNQIGWVKIGPDLGGAFPVFCPALPDGSPTISPRTNEPTLTPSESPIEKFPTVSPVPYPSSSLIPGPSPSKKPTHPVFGKSSKSKTPKPTISKSGKSGSKASKPNSAYGSGQGYLNAHLVYEDFMMNSSSTLSSYGLSLVTLAVTYCLSGGL